MYIHSVTPNACGLKEGLRTAHLILSGRRSQGTSLFLGIARDANYSCVLSLDRSGARSSRPILAHSDRFDQFDQSLKQCLPIVLGFDKMARLRFQALAQARIADNFESRVGELARRVGDHQVFAVNDRSEEHT